MALGLILERVGAAAAVRVAHGRLTSIGIRVAFGALALYAGILVIIWVTTPNLGPAAGTGDHATYMAAARRWLSGGSFYLPYQLSGPYVVDKVEILYPPISLPLLILFSALPDVLWWVIPIGILAAVVTFWRPGLLGWTAILACIAAPSTFEMYAYGNPAMWVAAFVALGTVWGWPAVLVALKPSLAPFMFIGIHRRSWWLGFGLLGLASLAFLPMWFDYAKVVLNARGSLVSPLYSLGNVPVLLIPLIARLDSRRRANRRDTNDPAPVSIPATASAPPGQDL